MCSLDLFDRISRTIESKYEHNSTVYWPQKVINCSKVVPTQALCALWHGTASPKRELNGTERSMYLTYSGPLLLVSRNTYIYIQ